MLFRYYIYRKRFKQKYKQLLYVLINLTLINDFFFFNRKLVLMKYVVTHFNGI